MNRFAFRKLHYDNDISFLYDLITDPNEQIMFQTNKPINSMRDFQMWFDGNLRNEYHDFYILEDLDNKNVVGFVYSYAYKQYDLHCKIAVILFPHYRKMGIGAMATLSFMKQLFKQYPLRKIYVDIYDYNQESLKSNISAGFEIEGVLKEYRYLNGKYHSLNVLSISRECFEKRYRDIELKDYFVEG